MGALGYAGIKYCVFGGGGPEAMALKPADTADELNSQEAPSQGQGPRTLGWDVSNLSGTAQLYRCLHPPPNYTQGINLSFPATKQDTLLRVGVPGVILVRRGGSSVAAAPLPASISPFITQNHEPDPQHEAFCNVAMKTRKENRRLSGRMLQGGLFWPI